MILLDQKATERDRTAEREGQMVRPDMKASASNSSSNDNNDKKKKKNKGRDRENKIDVSEVRIEDARWLVRQHYRWLACSPHKLTMESRN